MLDSQVILHPTDFSENSRPAFEMACVLARDFDATLLILHVMMSSVAPLMNAPPPDPSRPADSQVSARFPWPKPSDPSIRVQHRVAEGDPAEEILRLSNTLGCKMIVMGTHGASGLARLLTGSVAEEVLREAGCPVLVIKAPPHAERGEDTERAAGPGEIVAPSPTGPSPESARTRTLLETGGLKIVRLVVPAGQEIPSPAGEGEVVAHCLDGQVAFAYLGQPRTLEAGKLVALPAREPCTFRGIEDSCLLLTIVSPRT